ncbi:hypothetical protein HK105_206335 [Polyrhizophydium stewartii]|uniref:C2 domain-containing protein n=1 Tax=Polyrhizophydium stewartii TaxID=2732419 RepID=A0ABR4N3J2_9FUNG
MRSAAGAALAAVRLRSRSPSPARAASVLSIGPDPRQSASSTLVSRLVQQSQGIAEPPTSKYRRQSLTRYSSTNYARLETSQSADSLASALLAKEGQDGDARQHVDVGIVAGPQPSVSSSEAAEALSLVAAAAAAETPSNGGQGNTIKKSTKKRKKRNKRKEEEEDMEPMKDEDLAEFEKPVEDVMVVTELKKWIPNWKLIAQGESKILFHPMTHPLDLPPTWMDRVRNLEEEGIFVGALPAVPSHNVETMLHAISGERWLGPEKKVAIEPDPLQYVHNRPNAPIFLDSHEVEGIHADKPKWHRFDVEDPHAVHFDPETALELRPAFSAHEHARLLAGTAGTFILAVDLVGIQFCDHPLMIEEVRLANSIADIASTIRERRRANLVEFLTLKLDALRHEYTDFCRASPFSDLAVAAVESPSPGTDPASEAQAFLAIGAAPQDGQQAGIFAARPLRGAVLSRLRGAEQQERARIARLNDEATRWSLLQDIHAMRLLRDAEAQTDRLLEFKILKAWEALKAMRSSSGFSSTSLSVKIVVRQPASSDGQGELEREITAELAEMQDMHHIEQIRRRREYEQALEAWTAKHKEALEQRERRRSEREAMRLMRSSESALQLTSSTDLSTSSSNPLSAIHESRNLETVGEARATTEMSPDKHAAAGANTRAEEGGTSDGVEADRTTRHRKRLSMSSKFLPNLIDRVRSLSPTRRTKDPVDAPSVAENTQSAGAAPAKHAESLQVAQSQEAADNIDSSLSPTEPKTKAFNAKKIRSQITKRLEASRRPPGCPALSFVIEKGNHTTETAACPKHEASRRRELEATFVYLRFYCNNREVMRTVARPLDSASFALKFSGADDLCEAEHLVKAVSRQHGDSGPSKSAFCIKVSEPPRSLRVEIYEAGVFGDSFVGEVNVPIPEPSDHADALDREICLLQFTGRPFVPADLGGRTPKPTLALSGGVSDERWIGGILKLSASWAVFTPGSAMAPAHRRQLEWVADMRLDPNDPRNGDIMRLKALLRSVSGLENPSVASVQEYWHSRSVLRLGLPRWLHRMTLSIGVSLQSTPLAIIDFVVDNTKPPEDEPPSKRIELLAARHRREVLVREPVPIIEDDITPEIYEPVQRNDPGESETMDASWNTHTLRESTSRQPVDKSVRLGFIKRVRELQLVRKAQLARPISVDDYVREERMQPPPEQQNPLEMLFRPKRPLNPLRNDRRAAATSNPDSCRIVVQVLRGFNLPVRRATVKRVEAATQAPNAAPLVYVAPFVEIGFQQRKIRTATAEGQNPQWNETVYLDVSVPEDDFRADSLNDSDIGTEMLFVNLFDEVIVDLIVDERERATSVHHRREHVWLGSLQIPFSTIWEQSRIDGEFKIRLPPQSLGYERKQVETPAVGSTEASNETLLHLFVTLDPPLAQPSPLKLRFQSEEVPRLLRYATSWLASLEPLKRIVLATTLDLQGKTRLICRFVRPQEPPARLTTVAHLRRFVSMIPHIPNRTAFGCECSLWSNTQEILHVGAANAVEHAIVLCNFLLARGHDAYVLLGRGIPEGSTAYVLVKPEAASSLATTAAAAATSASAPDTAGKTAGRAAKSKRGEAGTLRREGTQTSLSLAPPNAQPGGKMQKSDSSKDLASPVATPKPAPLAPGWLLFHPVTGEEHDLTDAHLPLKQVGCVFNHENIWVNVQQDASPGRIHFRFENQGAWKPFFGPQFEKKDSKSIQPVHIKFHDPQPRFLTDLEAAIEAAVVAKIEEWRQGRVTRWNSRALKSLMARFEADVIAGVPVSRALESSPELTTIGNVYKLCGFPLNAPFTDIAALCALVHNTAVHVNHAMGVEFALAVHCHGYPSRFVSVWVYVASLVRHQWNSE